MLSTAAAIQSKKATDYLLTLNLSADHLDQDAVITPVLRILLDMSVTPRKLTEGRSLETQFLEVTGTQSDSP
jgi:hypothetical protein